MSQTLKMADGDLFIDGETGRGVQVQGAQKVDQELAELLLQTYDPARDWGSQLQLQQFSSTLDVKQLQSLLYLRVSQATQRYLAKQARDANLGEDEVVSGFPRVEVKAETKEQNLYFLVVAQLGDGAVLTKAGALAFKPTSLKQVLPPPPFAITRGLGG